MAKYYVQFEVRKGTSVGSPGTEVEADSHQMAQQMAEAKLRSMYPSFRDHSWILKNIKEKKW